MIAGQGTAVDVSARPKLAWNPKGSRGAKGNRTPDLFHAMEALYQLSYSPGSL